MVTETELEALRRNYPDRPWPRRDPAAEPAAAGWASGRAGAPAVEARPSVAWAVR